jgi:acetyl esterase/lipase
MGLLDRVDPELRAGLQRYLLATGPEGLNTGDDIVERRRRLDALVRAAGPRAQPDVTVQDEVVAGADGRSVAVRVYRPAGREAPLPALLYLHAGGTVMGAPWHEDVPASRITSAVGCVTLSVDYRLAPEHPYPAALDDCEAVLRAVVDEPGTFAVDPARVALYGRSAGGGIAAGLALRLRDQDASPRLALQLLVFPMLDDRNETAASHEITDLRVWDRSANVQAWSWYLAQADRDAVPAEAAANRARDLAGLPPTYLETGELDLFRDEDLDFATRLLRAGVPTELHVYRGAYHGFDEIAPAADVSRRAMAARIGALQRALGPEGA